MTPPPSVHPRVPRGRARVGGHDLQIIQRATLLIDDLGSDLDRRLTTERRATERLRLLRESTNRITRAANDAIHAYARARRRVHNVLERSDGDPNVEDAVLMRASLDAARHDLLRALQVASRRYPWTGAFASDSDAGARGKP